MAPADTPSSPAGPRLSLRGDRLMLGVLAASLGVAVAIGTHFGQPGLALLVGVPLLLAGAAATWMAPGSQTTRVTLAVTQMAMVALHIQLGRGLMELHFGVFVTLAFLLIYRDWRPVLAGAGVIAVHHLLFDRLQAGGLGVYCLTEPDLPRVLVHAGYVVAQTAFEVHMALLMRRDARQGEELQALVRHVQQPAGQLALDVSGLAVETHGGRALQGMLQQVGETVRSVRQSIDSIQTASAEIAAGSTDLSQRTETAASHLQQTASNMSVLTGTLRQTADAARTASQLTASATEVAQRGGAAMDGVVRTMQEIQQASRQIAEITGVIDGIAFQTNILALNAAVEAARAGEQGRGFAVVAGEVRSLAQRSAEAARQIKGLIGASVEKVETGTHQVQTAGSTMADIVQSVQRVTDIVGEITVTAGQQSENVDEVHAAVGHLDATTQQNAALVEQSAAAAESLQSQARHLAGAMGRFR